MTVPVQRAPSAPGAPNHFEPPAPHAHKPEPSAALVHRPGLDGVRGIAILLVLVYHFVTQAVPLAPTSAVGKGIVSTLAYGWSGVDLFFVLSGCLITGILLEARGVPGRARAFYGRRALRIFPLYYLLVVGVAGVAWLAGIRAGAVTFVHEHQAWYWAFVPNGLATYLNTVDVPLFFLWSVAIEEQFYLIWPWIVWSVRRDRTLAMICAAGIAGSLAFRTWLWATGRSYVPGYVLPFARADALLAGGLIAIAVRNGYLTAALRRNLWWAAGVSAVALVVFHAANLGVPTRIFGYSLNVVIAAACVTAAHDAGGAWANPVLRWFGRYSYGLYMLHPFLLSPLHHVWDKVGLPPNGAVAVVVAACAFFGFVALACGAALTSWTLMEGPALRLKRYFPLTPGGATR
ncbi:MAG: acyltransferase [Gemmatirosa sp.]|nr:acyltransferase [Gemmatirosa sp.]